MKRLAALLLLVSAACVTPATPRFSLAAPEKLAQAPGDEKWPAVVLLDERSLRHSVYATAETIFEQHRAVRVMRDDGLSWAAVRLRVLPGEELVSLIARTILPGGESVALDPRDIVWGSDLETCGSAGRAYRSASFALPRAVPGAVIEYRYVIRHVGWAWAYEYAVVEPVPVRAARFELDTFDGFEVNAKARGFDERDPCPPADRGRRMGCWTVSNVLPPPREPLLGSRERSAPRVAFSIAKVGTLRVQDVPVRLDQKVYDGWPAVAFPSWMAIAYAVAKPAPAIAEPRPASLGNSGVAEVWRRVNATIADKKSLCEYADGARSVKEIVASGYGTGAERLQVLLSVLLSWGYEAGLALFPDEDHEDPAKDFASPTELQRAVLWVRAQKDEPLTMLDPDCLGCAAGELSPSLRGRSGMLVEPPPRRSLIEDRSVSKDAQLIVRGTKLLEAVEPLQIEAELSLEDRGLVARRGKWRATGSAAATLRHHFAENPLPPAELEERLRKRYLDGVEEGRVWVGDLGSGEGPVEVHYEDVLYARTGYVRSGEWTVIPLRALFGGEWIDALDRERHEPVDFELAPSWVHVVKLRVPGGASVHALPEPGKVELPAGNYRLDVTREDGAVVISETLDIQQRHHEGDAYPQLYRFVEAIRALRGRPVVLRR